MRLMIAACMALGVALPGARGANAQQDAQIPIRPLGPVVAKSAESFGIVAGVRGVAGGKVLVNDPQRRRLWLLDSAMARVTAVADTAGANTVYSPRGGGIIRFAGDSTLFVDVQSQALIVVDPAGAVGRALAPPKATDIQYLIATLNGPIGVNPGNTMPGIDAKGQLIYKGFFRIPPKPPVPGQPFTQTISPDSAPLIRGNFETRAVDTLATIRTPSFGSMTQTLNGNTPSGKITFHPLHVFDDWSVLSDGTIAIVRSQDYHIDWIDPDGSRRSTPKMPFDWRRLTDDEKQHYADSTKAWLQHAIDSAFKTIPAGQKPPFIPTIDVSPLSEIPDYLSPIGAVRPDLDGHLWVLPATSRYARNGLLYDVVNRNGEIIERVQLPPGRTLEGFGPNGTVYLSLKAGNDTYLERARLR